MNDQMCILASSKGISTFNVILPISATKHVYVWKLYECTLNLTPECVCVCLCVCVFVCVSKCRDYYLLIME